MPGEGAGKPARPCLEAKCPVQMPLSALLMRKVRTPSTTPHDTSAMPSRICWCGSVRATGTRNSTPTAFKNDQLSASVVADAARLVPQAGADPGRAQADHQHHADEVAGAGERKRKAGTAAVPEQAVAGIAEQRHRSVARPCTVAQVANRFADFPSCAAHS